MTTKTTTNLTESILLTFCLLFGAVGLLILPAFPAAADGYYCKHIGIQDGLSQPSVTCIGSDSQGTIWIGTRFGLNKYKNHSVQTFVDDGKGGSSLKGNHINLIFHDSSGCLWVSTEEGLFLYDDDIEKFVQMSENAVRSALENEDQIYFGGRDRILICGIAEHGFKETPVPDADQIISIQKYRSTQFLVTDKHSGVNLFDISTLSLKKIDVPELNEDVILSARLIQGKLYVSVYRKGLYVTDIEQQKVLYKYDSGNSGLTFDVILDEMAVDEELWLATDGGGICILDTRTGRIREFEDNEKLSNSVTALHKDAKGNIWAGSVRSGVYGLKNTTIHTLNLLNSEDNVIVSNNVIIDLWQADNGTVWAGTDGSGVVRMDADGNGIASYPSTDGLKISSLSEFDSERLILSVYTKGLFLMDKRSGGLTPFKVVNDSVNFRECFSEYSPMLYKTDSENICILAENAYKYNVRTGQFSKFSHSDALDISEMHIFGGNRDNVFYAWSGKSIFSLNDSRMAVSEIYSHKGSSPIKSAAYSSGKIWFGTDYGLYCVDAPGGEAKPVPTGIFSRVTWLTTTGNNLLWIAADNMLFCYHIDEQRFEVVDESDGFSPNEILCSTLPGDRFADVAYLGGTMGLVEIQSEYALMHSRPTDTELHLSGVYIDGHKTGIRNGRLRVPYKTGSVTIAVGIRDIDPFKKEVYRYEISGEQALTHETYSDELVLQKLPAGTYSISASFLTNDGSWSEPRNLLSIRILPPWYRSPWLFLSLFAAIVAAAWGIVAWINARNKARLHQTLMEQKAKESERQVRFLVNVSHELRTPLTLVYSPLKMIVGKIGDSALKERLNKVFVQAGKMRDIINSVLEKERLETLPETLYDKETGKVSYTLSNIHAAPNIQAAPNIHAAKGGSGCDVTDCTVLFAEDNADLRELLRESMTDYFKEVWFACTGDEALAMIREKGPDIVVSDIMLAEMDGFELCKALKSDIEISHIPIILLTAKGDAESLLNGYKSGADAYLTKPFDIELLVTVIGNILKGRESVRRQMGNFTENTISPVEGTFTQADEQLMTRLDKYIRDNIGDENIDVPKIVSEMAISRALLYVKVKALTGMGIAQYIDKIRIQTACEMLRNTGSSIADVAEATGFSSAKYFSGHFKQVTGKSPSEYRKGR